MHESYTSEVTNAPSQALRVNIRGYVLTYLLTYLPTYSMEQGPSWEAS